MALSYKTESLDGLSDAEKQHYKEAEGGNGYVLDLDDKNDERVQGLIQNRNAALAEKDQLQAKLKEFEGIDPKAAKEATAKIQSLEDRLAKAKTDGSSDEKVERIKADLQAEYDKVVQEKDQKINSLEQQFTKTMKNDSIKSALRQAGVREAAVDMLQTYLDSRVTVVTGDTGQLSARVLKNDGSGDYEVSTKDGSVYKSVEELVEDMKVDKNFAFVFDGSKASGGGTPPNTNAPNGSGQGGGQFTGEFAHVAYRSDLGDPATKAKFITYLKEKHCDGDGAKAQQMFFKMPAQRPQ